MIHKIKFTKANPGNCAPLDGAKLVRISSMIKYTAGKLVRTVNNNDILLLLINVRIFSMDILWTSELLYTYRVRSFL